MSKKGTIIKGTFILTLTGFLSRVIGFFYRIFLSHTFGEEGVGLYQLIFPVFALGFSFTAAGIQVALSRIIAQKVSLGRHREAKHVLFTGLLISLTLSIAVTIFLQTNAQWIAVHLLGDIRCINLLIAMSYAFPFASVHSCVCGYYLGLKNTKELALSQLVEQTVRVASVYIICTIMLKQNIALPVTVAVFGLVIGDVAAAFYCILTFSKSKTVSARSMPTLTNPFSGAKELLIHSVPLTANRVLLNILQSIEAVSIPGCLMLAGFSNSNALSIYGVLTGMALPCILFPSAVTSSVSTMLLPTIAEIQATNNRQTLIRLIRQVTACVFALGCLCTLFFLLTGNFVGNLLFHSTTAGKFIITLAWICPFLYTNTTFISVLNGLGKTTSSFLINTIGLCIRIGGVFFLIPVFGITGYLWGLLGSQFLISSLCICCLKKYLST